MKLKKLIFMGIPALAATATISTAISCSSSLADGKLKANSMTVAEFRKKYNDIIELDIDNIEFKNLDSAAKARADLMAMNNNTKEELKDVSLKIERIWNINSEYYYLGWTKLNRIFQRQGDEWSHTMAKTSFQNIRLIVGWAEEFNAADPGTQRIIAERHPSYVDAKNGYAFEKARDAYEKAKKAYDKACAATDNSISSADLENVKATLTTKKNTLDAAKRKLLSANAEILNGADRFYPKDVYNSLKKKGDSLIEWRRDNYRMLQPSDTSINMIIDGITVANTPGLTKSQRIRKISDLFMGKEYGQNRLIGSHVAEEIMIADLENPDCFTYLDYVVALLITKMDTKDSEPYVSGGEKDQDLIANLIARKNKLDEANIEINGLKEQLKALESSNSRDDAKILHIKEKVRDAETKLETETNARREVFDKNSLLKRYISNLIKVRYKGGFIDYFARKHFFTDWGVSDPIVAENLITTKLKDVKKIGSDGKEHSLTVRVEKYINVKGMTTKKVFVLDEDGNKILKDGEYLTIDAPVLKNGKVQVKDVYLTGIEPKKRIFDALKFSRDTKLFNYKIFNENFVDGDLVMVGTDIPGLDVTHDGFMIFKEGQLYAHDVDSGTYYDENGRAIANNELGVKNYRGHFVKLYDKNGKPIMTKKPFYRNASFSASKHYGSVKDKDLVGYFVDRNWDTTHGKWYDDLNSQDLRDKGMEKAQLAVPCIVVYRVKDEIKYSKKT